MMAMGNVETALHISLGSQFGSLARLMLKKLFGATHLHLFICIHFAVCRGRARVLRCVPGQKCDVWAFASCATQDAQSGSALFQDLPSNAIGSFILGVMSSAQVVGADVVREVAVLGPESPFQRYKALHTGLRTGFCGSLTTFSSWCVCS